MSCTAIESSNFFSSKSVFANVECKGSFAFLGFTVLNVLVAFFSNYVFTLRQQQRRMLLKVPRFESGRESDRWRSNFHKFLYLTAASQTIYVVQVVFIITTSLWQLLVLVIASTVTDWILYEYSYVTTDKYDMLRVRDDIQ
jgi:hypothetical protein